MKDEKMTLDELKERVYAFTRADVEVLNAHRMGTFVRIEIPEEVMEQHGRPSFTALWYEGINSGFRLVLNSGGADVLEAQFQEIVKGLM